MPSSIPFQIPFEFLARLQAGELIRFGSILKDAATGRIVGHVQETGLAQSIISAVTHGIPTPFSLVGDLVDIGSGVYTAMGISQLKVMMATLQTLQIATLGTSLLGVGITAAGFVYVHKRFNKIERRIDEMIDTLNKHFDDNRRREIRLQMALTHGLLERAKQASSRSNPVAEYSNIADELVDHASFYRQLLIDEIASPGKIDIERFREFSQALMLCNAIRIECRLRTSELKNAFEINEAVAGDYSALFQRLTPVSFSGGIEVGFNTIKTLREVTNAAASKSYLIDYLHVSRIAGRDYLDAIGRETKSAALILEQR